MKTWLGPRIGSIVLLTSSGAWALYVLPQAADGPPIGALFMIGPALAGMLVGAAIWPAPRKS